jgi:outer membrane protein
MSIKIIMTALVTALVTSGFFLYKKNEKTGYIQIQKVFNEFNYKKEMEAKLKKVEEYRKHELDSLELQLKVLFKEVELNKKDVSKVALFQTNREEFLNKRERYEEDYRKAVAQYDEIIIKQMNQYIREFGEVKKYKYLFGTDGKGNLMYADSTNDVTKEVMAFINQKYTGKIKK